MDDRDGFNQPLGAVMIKYGMVSLPEIDLAMRMRAVMVVVRDKIDCGGLPESCLPTFRNQPDLLSICDRGGSKKFDFCAAVMDVCTDEYEKALKLVRSNSPELNSHSGNRIPPLGQIVARMYATWEMEQAHVTAKHVLHASDVALRMASGNIRKKPVILKNRSNGDDKRTKDAQKLCFQLLQAESSLRAGDLVVIDRKDRTKLRNSYYNAEQMFREAGAVQAANAFSCLRTHMLETLRSRLGSFEPTVAQTPLALRA